MTDRLNDLIEWLAHKTLHRLFPARTCFDCRIEREAKEQHR